MKGFWIAALIAALAGSAEAASVTVLGSMGGRMFYDGKDQGAIPLKDLLANPFPKLMGIISAVAFSFIVQEPSGIIE